MKITREAFEHALDANRLDTRYYDFLIGGPMDWHRCRRAGKTSIVTRDHGRFLIPIAFSLSDLVNISQAEFADGHVDIWFRIVA